MNQPRPCDEPASKDVEDLLLKWGRDLSVCSEEELRQRWPSLEERKAIDRLDPVGFEKRVKGHSWLYWVAQNLFFSNVLNDPGFLDRIFHVERICHPTEVYLQQEKPDKPGLVCLAQRDSLKSSFYHGVIPVAFALRRWWLFGEHTRIILLHEKDELASGSLVRMKKRTVGSQWFADVWAPFHSPCDFGTSSKFTWPHVPDGLFQEPSVFAAGMTSEVVGWHFDLLCFSDMVNKKHRYSRALREEASRNFSGMIHAKDTRRSWVTIDGTLYHPQDQNASLLAAKDTKGQPLYHQIVLGAGGKRAGLPLSLPHRHTEEVLEARRAEIIAEDGNDDMWWLQYQNRINTERMLVASTSWIRHCRLSDVPAEGLTVVLVDPAWKGTFNFGKGDHAAIEVWKVVRKGSLLLRYLLDGCYSNEMSQDHGKSEILRLCRKYGSMHIAPEERGGYGFRTELSQFLVSHGWPATVVNLKSMQRKKADRAAGFVSLLEGGFVWFCEEADPVLVDALTEQIGTFPSCIDEEDDAIDCAGYLNDPAIADLIAPSLPVDESYWARMMRQKEMANDRPTSRYGAN